MLRGGSIKIVLGVLALALGGCGGNQAAQEVRARYEPVNLNNASKIGVNGFLWQATLDTLAFMPLRSTDPQGGVIVSDWYVNPDAGSERFSLTVYIQDRTLRADALDVNVHRQVFDPQRGWVDAATRQETVGKLEDAILKRARELRLGMVVRNG